jgi:hypothetical protein
VPESSGAAVGLSVGSTRFTGVLGRAAVMRQSVLTVYRHRPPELGVPSENPNLSEPGVIITGFVDRVGDPVGIVGSDGTARRGEDLVADALRALLYDVNDGRPSLRPAIVTHPAHWRRATVYALRRSLERILEGSRHPIALVSDAAAAVSALQAEQGMPARGVIALCDFGGTGTSIALLDASNGYQPIGPGVRHADFSGDLIDQALLTQVIADLSAAAAVDASGTSALGPLQRLRAQCRSAKERLSAASVTALPVEIPGFRADVRLTRAELEDQIGGPLAAVVHLLQNTLDRNGFRPADLAAVASTGGGARIPLITATLSEHFRVPVITSRRPVLTAAAGAALRAAWGPADDRSTAMAPAPVLADEEPQSQTFRALAWSEAHDVPPVVPPVESFVDPEPSLALTGVSAARPELQFEAAADPPPVQTPWYKRGSTFAGVAAGAVVLLSASAVVALGNDNSPASITVTLPPSTTVAAPTSPAAAPPTEIAAAPEPQDPPIRTVTVAPPPVTHMQAPATQPAEPPPPTTTTTTTTPPPPPTTVTTTVTTTAPAPTTQSPTPEPPPTTQTSAPPAPSTQPSATVRVPAIPTIPRLPVVILPRDGQAGA